LAQSSLKLILRLRSIVYAFFTGLQLGQVTDGIPNSDVIVACMRGSGPREGSSAAITDKKYPMPKLRHSIVSRPKDHGSDAISKLSKQALYRTHEVHISKADDILDKKPIRPKHIHNSGELANKLISRIRPITSAHSGKALTWRPPNHPVRRLFQDIAEDIL